MIFETWAKQPTSSGAITQMQEPHYN